MAKTEISPNLASGAQNFSSPAALVTKMRLRPGVEAEFTSWHAKICTFKKPGTERSIPTEQIMREEAVEVWKIVQKHGGESSVLTPEAHFVG